MDPIAALEKDRIRSVSENSYLSFDPIHNPDSIKIIWAATLFSCGIIVAWVNQNLVNLYQFTAGPTI